MKHQNHVVLAGPVTNVTEKLFAEFGFLNLNINGVKVKVTLGNKDFGLTETAKTARSAVVTGGFFEANEDKKKPGEWWFNLGARPNAIAFLEQEVGVVNFGTVVGAVKNAEAQWMMVAASYHVPGKGGGQSTWKDRLVRVYCPFDTSSLLGREVLVTGSARPKVDGTWYFHMAAEGIWILR